MGQSVAEKLSIQYCLTKPVEERCRAQSSIVIMIVVIGCNFLKASYEIRYFNKEILGIHSLRNEFALH